MANRSGYLTVSSPDRSEIYGEFCDALWEVEKVRGGSNHVFSAVAGDGTLEAFRRINTEGIANIAYTFESNGYRYMGNAQLLPPTGNGMPGQGMIRIETGDMPARA